MTLWDFLNNSLESLAQPRQETANNLSFMLDKPGSQLQNLTSP